MHRMCRNLASEAKGTSSALPPSSPEPITHPLKLYSHTASSSRACVCPPCLARAHMRLEASRQLAEVITMPSPPIVKPSCLRQASSTMEQRPIGIMNWINPMAIAAILIINTGL